MLEQNANLSFPGYLTTFSSEQSVGSGSDTRQANDYVSHVFSSAIRVARRRCLFGSSWVARYHGKYGYVT